MTVLSILTYPNPVLWQKSKPVTEFDTSLARLVDDMFDTMRASQGVGLAAPQVGILKQICVVEYNGRKIVLINPKVIAQKGRVVEEEGCLSVPNRYESVERFEHISVEAFDVNQNKQLIQECGFIARIIQHELDHLSGILFIDRNKEE